MTIWEAKKEQLKSIKNRSFKEQISYLWDYYGIKAICLLLALITLIAFIVTLATKKDYALTGVFFGAQPQDSTESYLEDFSQFAGIDLDDYELSIQCHPNIHMDQQITQDIYSSMETFTAMVASQSVDCFAGNPELFLYYAYLEYAADLRTVLDPEELEQLSPYLHYIDGALIRQQESANGGLTDAYFQRADSTRPELMTDPIPVGISVDAANDAFGKYYPFEEDGVIGICASAPYPENAAAFLRYCLN